MQVRPARPEDAAALAPKLRDADRREIAATSGEGALEVLTRSIRTSRPCYAVVGDQAAPAGLFGVIPDRDQDGVGSIWLLGSDELLHNRMFFLRNSRPWIARLHEGYSVLWNYVDARNEVHLRWIAWCGFRFVRCIEKHGAGQCPFYEFESIPELEQQPTQFHPDRLPGFESG